MIQSLVREGSVDDLVAGYGQVIVDECHHVPAVWFERVLSEVKARFVTGLTATPRRRDGLHPILEMQLGPVPFAVDPRTQAARRPFEHGLIVRETTLAAGSMDPSLGIQTLYAALAADESRNRLIVDDVVHALGEGRTPILLTERKDHLEALATRLGPLVRHLVVLQGGMTPTERRDVTEQLARIPDTDPRLVLATGRYIGEGFDDVRLDTLFLTFAANAGSVLVTHNRVDFERLHGRWLDVGRRHSGIMIARRRLPAELARDWAGSSFGSRPRASRISCSTCSAKPTAGVELGPSRPQTAGNAQGFGLPNRWHSWWHLSVTVSRTRSHWVTQQPVLLGSGRAWYPSRCLGRVLPQARGSPSPPSGFGNPDF
jgi:Type III restriction enzyme, res subunit